MGGARCTEGKMPRSRVLSFMSAFGKPQGEHREQRPAPASVQTAPIPTSHPAAVAGMAAAPPSSTPVSTRASPTPRQRSNTVGRERSNSRPASMIGGYIPPIMDLAQNTIPELLPIFTLLNSHSNKLYQEGYFLKLNDLDVQGRPYPDRSWAECFAQLVGTVLSLWDAAALDDAGEEGEVAPTFINLADASIRMINTLQTRASEGQPLANVLSISTAGKNRYLLHFSSFNALSQWTSAIRLAMFENACLQEAYTGSLIAGKGRNLNAIKTIMTKTAFATEEWTRVRFGAGTPWRRCWCIISPPDEKEIKAQAKAAKKASAYNRSVPVVKGNIKFYDTRKVTKKTRPVATIRDAYSTYAVYPQSRALIDQSTLIKIEGVITIHAQPEVTTEGFIFVMPEVHPAISGFETMLRFLFPVYDIFHLYGRPTKLIADTLDTRGLMFALPQERRYGYLEIFDVATLINTEGSDKWSEREWRKRLKNLVSERVSRDRENASMSRAASRQKHRNSLPGNSSALRYADSDSMRSTPSLHRETGFAPPDRTDSAPPGDGVIFNKARHNRSVSENVSQNSPHRRVLGQVGQYTPSRLSQDQGRPSFEEMPPAPPTHGVPLITPHPGLQHMDSDRTSQNTRSSSGSEHVYKDAANHMKPLPIDIEHNMPRGEPLAPVSPPPDFAHQSASRPSTAPWVAPELRRLNSRMSNTTLSQLAAVNNPNAVANEQGNGLSTGDRPEVAADDYAQHSPRSPYLAANSIPQSVDPYVSSKTSSTDTLSNSFKPDNLRPAQNTQRRPSPLGQSPMLSIAASRYPASVSAPHLPLNPDIPSTDTMPLPPRRAVSSIARKPLPSRANSETPNTLPRVIDHSIHLQSVENAISQIQPARDIASGSDYDADSAGGYESLYSDSVKSPISASGHQAPIRNNQVRTGRLKTAGGSEDGKEIVVGDARYTHESVSLAAPNVLPPVDFGPTQIMVPDLPQQKQRPRSQMYPHSFETDNTSLPEAKSSRPGTAPDSSSNRRSMVWQPAAATAAAAALPARPDGRQGLTAEEFVQQRAHTAGRAALVFSDIRQQSVTPQFDDRRRLSKTPPGNMQRTPSGDWSAQYGRRLSTGRPRSQGASVARSPNPDISQRLSAREQEHIARVTNTPLLNLASQQQPKQESSGGLVSAIAAREQEKQAAKAGYGSQIVQQAIVQRAQQQQQQQQQHRRSYSSDPRLSPGLQMPSQFPSTPGTPGAWSQDYAQQMTYAQQLNQQGYFEDTYGRPGAYRAYSPNSQARHQQQQQQLHAQNRYSYQPQTAYGAQRTPSPQHQAYRLANPQDSYFNQGGYQGGYGGFGGQGR